MRLKPAHNAMWLHSSLASGNTFVKRVVRAEDAVHAQRWQSLSLKLFLPPVQPPLPPFEAEEMHASPVHQHLPFPARLQVIPRPCTPE